MPRMIQVDSSSIAAVGYDPLRKDLHVRFLENGRTYVYHQVEAQTYRDLLDAPSKGRYVNFSIKGHFDYDLWPD